MRFRSVISLSAILASAALFSFSSNAQVAPALDFTSPVEIGTSPQISTGMGTAATVFNGTIYLAFQSHAGGYLWISTSTDGRNFTDPGTAYKSILMSYAPSIAVFNNKLYIAYTTPSGGINVISSSDGVNFSAPVSAYTPSGIGVEVAATSPPTLVVFDGDLNVFWEINYPSTNTGEANDDNFTMSAETYNGTDWIQGNGYGCNINANQDPSILRPRSGSAVGAAVLNDTLYIATQLGDPQVDGSNELLVCSTANGSTYYPAIYPGSGISAAVFNGSLYLAFKYNHSNNMLELTGTDDGENFTTPVTSYGSIRINGNNEIAPSIIAFNGALYAYYTANNSDHYMYMVHSY
jgi:hypothetical protein